MCLVSNKFLYCSHNSMWHIQLINLNKNNLLLYTSFACNNNCSIDLYNRDLQTTIFLFTRNVSSHKTDWILCESPLLVLSCRLYSMVSSLMSALQGECLCLSEIFINIGFAKYLFILENALKKITKYFLKFIFLFESTIHNYN